jgi:oligosaccharide repeat unit polymerase
MDPYLWGMLMILVCGVWLLTNRILFNDLFSPFSLLLPAWILPLGLKALGLSLSEKPWALQTQLILAWTTFILTAVSLFTGFVLLQKRGRRHPVTLDKMIQEIGNRRTFAMICGVFFIGSLAFIYNEFITNPVGVPMLTYIQNPDISRDPNWQWKWGPLWPLAIPVCAFTPLLYLRAKIEPRRIWRYSFYGAAAFYPFMQLLKMSRSECLYAIVSVVLVEYYFRRQMSPVVGWRARLGTFWRKVVLVCLAIGLAVISATFFQQIRGSRPMSSNSATMGMDLDLPEPYLSTLVEIYGYFALPFENFSNFVNGFEPKLHLGVGLLRPAYSVLGKGEIARANMAAIDFDKYLEMLPINTYPFLASIYAEGGWVGVLIAPTVIALFVNLLYFRLRISPSLGSLSAYTMIISYCWLWIFCNSNFTGIQYYLYAFCFTVCIFMMSLIVMRPARKEAAPLRVGETSHARS